MRKTSLGKNIFILSISGILIKILSAANVFLLIPILGDYAYGVYYASYTIFIFILAVTSMGTQPAITKVVAEFRALGDYNSALRTMKIARKYLSLIGGTITILFMILAKPIAILFNWEQSILAMVVLAPTIFLSCILAAYRGYLQGMEDMESIAISQIIEQVINVTLSLSLSYIFNKISLELGVAGGTAGSSFGALMAVVFILYIYNKKKYQKDIRENNCKVTISDEEILKKISTYSLPITLVATMQNASTLVDASLVKSRLQWMGLSDIKAGSLYGLLGFYNTFLYVPLSLIIALSTAIFPKIIEAFTEENKDGLKIQINYLYRLIFIITIPSCIGLSILSKDIYIMFNRSGYELLLYGSTVLILMSLTTVQNTILQGVNKLYLVLITSSIGVIIKFILDFILVAVEHINIYGAIIASFISFLVPTIINHITIKRMFNIKISIIKLAMPSFISSIFMLIIIICLKLILNPFINGRILTGVVCLVLILIGALSYALMMILIGGVTKKDISLFSPKLYNMIPKLLIKIMK